MNKLTDVCVARNTLQSSMARLHGLLTESHECFTRLEQRLSPVTNPFPSAPIEGETKPCGSEMMVLIQTAIDKVEHLLQRINEQTDNLDL